MMLFTKENVRAMKANAKQPEMERKPIVKLFAPWGAATWLISEYNEDTGELFGLCDLGHGHPELGYVMRQEIEQITGPFGLRIERDRHWENDGRTLEAYADEAREKGQLEA